MGSPTSSLRLPLAARWDARRWPASTTHRAALRLALCLPYVAVATLAAARGIRSPTNVALVQQAGFVRWGSDHLGWISHAYPPIPVAVASLVPGGATTLGVVGALCTGGVLQICWERLVRSDTPWWLYLAVLAGLGGTPVFWYLATENLVGFVGLALFAAALASLLDFLFTKQTAGGFAAGICLGIAVLVDPAALVYTASALVAAPFLAWERFRGDRGAIRSTLTVLAFPSVAIVLAWAFFEWRFTGSAYHVYAVAPQAFRFPLGVVGDLRQAALGIGRSVLYTPLFVASGLLILRRRPIAVLGYLLVPIDLTVTRWLGLRYISGQSLVLLDLAAIIALPRAPGRRLGVFLLVVAAAQVALWCTLGLDHGPVPAWLASL